MRLARFSLLTCFCDAALYASLLLAAASSPSKAADLLTPGEPISLPGTHGKFDFIKIDATKRRLLAAHTGNASLDVIDLDKAALVESVATGAAQDVEVDDKANRYYVSVSKPPQLATVDAASLKVTAKVPVSGPADLVLFDSKAGKAYVAHDDASELWIVDPQTEKVTGSITLPSDSPEGLCFDASFSRLFQCMKTGSLVAVIDLATGKMTESWPTAPAQAPHGVAVVPEAQAILIAGGNGKLVMMSQKDGRILASAEIPPRVDEIAYDPGVHRVYCASGLGKVAIVGVESGALTPLGEVPSSEGCHSIAVDVQTHRVWIAYAKDGASFVRYFSPAP